MGTTTQTCDVCGITVRTDQMRVEEHHSSGEERLVCSAGCEQSVTSPPLPANATLAHGEEPFYDPENNEVLEPRHS